ncbi:MAG: hypothetical protein L3J59_13970 [Methylococcaceae bacterium]|nr:hypothetical protein [Methylococcaceae bacterium]
MKQEKNTSMIEKETLDFPTTVTIICHLMTLYAIKPCEPLATNINRHLAVLLESPAADSLGKWKDTFAQLLVQWKHLAKQHAKHATIKEQTNETHQVVSH